jgi:hypothetical protein
LARDLFIGLGTGYWNNSLFVFPTNLNIIDAEFAPLLFKLLPLCFSFAGLFLAFFYIFFFLKICIC